MHMSLRLAWHADGWNGRVCKNPQGNTYCVGSQSYPGEMIAEQRDVEWEAEEGVRGCHFSRLDRIPPCMYSANAFGDGSIMATADPPDFFRSGAKGIKFDLPPSTACVWPYEVMYTDDVKYKEEDGKFQTYNYHQRLANANAFFNKLSPGRSLIFYYANRSNPFSDDDHQAFVLVGVSRLKQLGDTLFYEDVSENIRKKYADGFVWQRPVTSHYPDQGFVIPYHRYMDDAKVLERICYIPEQQDNFKWAAQHITDDDALMYIERLIGVADALIEIKDDTQDWVERKRWLQELLAELWEYRGPYPGLPQLLAHLDFGELLQHYRGEVDQGNAKGAAEEILHALNDRTITSITGCSITPAQLDLYQRSWYTKTVREPVRQLASKVLVRIAVKRKQLGNILSAERAKNGLDFPLHDVLDNPYLLCEHYHGDDDDDEITFAQVDHAVLPSPELGLEPLLRKESWQRLRALCVEVLQNETVHTFVTQDFLLQKVNARLRHYPDWKKEEFNEAHIELDQNSLEHVLVFRVHDGKTYVYLKTVHANERTIETTIRDLAGRSPMPMVRPFGPMNWRNELYDPNSNLANKAAVEYETAITSQTEVGTRLMRRPLSVLAGSAGTGKTTVIRALMKAVQHTSGHAGSFLLLAPTGKAADRIRHSTGHLATTIHSLLSLYGWLYPNFSIKRTGGKLVEEYETIIIDECSMVDLSVMAALFRIINWNYVKRLVLVGDPNQLPPIGRGRVFADIIEFIREIDPDAYGQLTVNMRQMENRAEDKGNGIIQLASLFVHDRSQDVPPEGKAEEEALIKHLQESEEDVDKDLRIVRWKDDEDLERRLKEVMRNDLNGEEWKSMIFDFQALSPYRGERFGTQHLNGVLQRSFNAEQVDRFKLFGGVTAGDKVIQYVNRGRSKAYSAYHARQHQWTKLEVFNGELGQVKLHREDRPQWRTMTRLERVEAYFQREPNALVPFEKGQDVENNLELAYAISVHKAQGSEFDRVYFILPKHKRALMSTEMVYTGITRARRHLTILVQEDLGPLLSLRRPERAKLRFINSSLFAMRPVSEEMLNMRSWYEEGKIHRTLSNHMVRSKSEVIIANMLHDQGMPDFTYEEPLQADDGTWYLPDFTIRWRGKVFYWEHLGRLDDDKYARHWAEKDAWYKKHYAGQLLTTKEGSDLSQQAQDIIQTLRAL